MSHFLVGKQVILWHDTTIIFPYQPVLIVMIEEPFIYVEPYEKSEWRGGMTGEEMKPIWIPISRIAWIEEVEQS